MRIGITSLATNKRPPEEWSVPLPPELKDPGDGGLTLRELLTLIVRGEVEQFHRRQRERTLIQVLTSQQIEQQAAQGKIASGGQEYRQKVDVEEAVATALQGFEDGLYLVFIDEIEQRDLDAQVYVSDDSRLTFLPLTFLSGI